MEGEIAVRGGRERWDIAILFAGKRWMGVDRAEGGWDGMGWDKGR